MSSSVFTTLCDPAWQICAIRGPEQSTNTPLTSDTSFDNDMTNMLCCGGCGVWGVRCGASDRDEMGLEQNVEHVGIMGHGPEARMHDGDTEASMEKKIETKM